MMSLLNNEDFADTAEIIAEHVISSDGAITRGIDKNSIRKGYDFIPVITRSYSGTKE